MTKQLMTYEAAMAAARDAATTQMKEAGRTSWEIEDLNAASRVFAAIFAEFGFELPISQWHRNEEDGEDEEEEVS